MGELRGVRAFFRRAAVMRYAIGILCSVVPLAVLSAAGTSGAELVDETMLTGRGLRVRQEEFAEGHRCRRMGRGDPDVSQLSLMLLLDKWGRVTAGR